MTNLLSILLADHHALFRGGMRHLLSDLPLQISITESMTGQETIDLLRTGRFDLIMIEFLMPDFLPVPLLNALRTEAGGTPYIVVSAAEDPEKIHAALENGAAGFVPKSCPPKVMLQAVMLVLSGGIYIPPSVLTQVRRAVPDGIPDEPYRSSDLTPRQRAVLQYLATGYSNKQIASALDLSEGTVKSHIASILKALGAKNRTHAIIIASHRGILPHTH